MLLQKHPLGKATTTVEALDTVDSIGKAFQTKCQQTLQACRPKSTSTPRSLSIYRFDDADEYRISPCWALVRGPVKLSLCGSTNPFVPLRRVAVAGGRVVLARHLAEVLARPGKRNGSGCSRLLHGTFRPAFHLDALLEIFSCHHCAATCSMVLTSIDPHAAVLDR